MLLDVEHIENACIYSRCKQCRYTSIVQASDSLCTKLYWASTNKQQSEQVQAPLPVLSRLLGTVDVPSMMLQQQATYPAGQKAPTSSIPCSSVDSAQLVYDLLASLYSLWMFCLVLRVPYMVRCHWSSTLQSYDDLEFETARCIMKLQCIIRIPGKCLPGCSVTNSWCEMYAMSEHAASP